MSLIVKLFAVIFDICLIAYADSLREKRLKVIIADAIVAFFVTYMGLSLFLFKGSHFTVSRVIKYDSLLIILAVAALVGGRKFLLHKSIKPEKPDMHMDIPAVIVIAVGVLATIYKSGISTASIHQNYYLYHAFSYSNYSINDALAFSCGYADFYYGSPAFPSVLALATFFVGYRWTLLINFIFSICFGVLASTVCDELHIKGINKYLILGLTLMSPMMISSAKTAYAYMFVTMLLAGAVKEAIQIVKHKSTWLPLFICIAGIMATTLKSLFFMPLIVLIGALLVAYTSSIRYKIMTLVTSLTQLAILYYVYKICPTYVYRDWWSWLNFSSDKDPYGATVAGIICVAFILLSAILFLPKATTALKNTFTDNGYLKALGIIGATEFTVAMLKIIFRYICHDGKVALTESTLALTISTGVVIIPLAVFFLISRKMTKPVSGGLAIIATVFIYGLFIICVSEVPYLGSSVATTLMPMTPFMLMGIILAVSFIAGEEEIVIKKQLGKNVLAVIAIVTMLPFSIYSMIYRPETALDMADFVKINDYVANGNNAIRVRPDAQPFQFPLKLTSSARIYVEGDQIPDEFDNVYILSYNPDEMSEVIMTFEAKNCSISRTDTTNDLLAVYTIIGVRPINSSKVLYFGR